MYRILFVCTGNICRSPTAEAVFRQKARLMGVAERFHVDSAGTHGYHVGEAPDHRTVQTAVLRGVDMHELRARKISPRDFEEFDFILALDETHYEQLKQMKPKKARTILAKFLDYHPAHKGKDVPDPYYGAQSDFDHVFDLVDKGAEALLQYLLKP